MSTASLPPDAHLPNTASPTSELADPHQTPHRPRSCPRLLRAVPVLTNLEASR